MQITGLLVLCGGNKKAPGCLSDGGWLIMMHFAGAMRLRKSLIAAAFIALLVFLFLGLWRLTDWAAAGDVRACNAKAPQRTRMAAPPSDT